jgi:hypothetical protein
LDPTRYFVTNSSRRVLASVPELLPSGRNASCSPSSIARIRRHLWPARCLRRRECEYAKSASSSRTCSSLLLVGATFSSPQLAAAVPPGFLIPRSQVRALPGPPFRTEVRLASRAVTSFIPSVSLRRYVRTRPSRRTAALRGLRERVIRTRRTAEPVLFDLQAHELLVGEWLAQDLLQPDRFHPVFHRRMLRTHRSPSSLRDAAWQAPRTTSLTRAFRAC